MGFIEFSRTKQNLAGRTFEAKLKDIAPRLKLWVDFNEIAGVRVDKQKYFEKLYHKGLHGVYFDDSAEYFDPLRTKLYLDPRKTGFASAQVSKQAGVTMSDVIQALLRYEALRLDTKLKYDSFPEISIAPPPAVYHLVSWP